MDEEVQKMIREAGLAFNKRRQWDKPTKPEQLTQDFIENLLANTPDDDLVFKILDCVDGIVGRDYSNQFDTVMSLPDGFIAIWITSRVDGEIMNGGYNQYFFNSSGQFTDAAPHAFRMIGSKDRADIHEEANILLHKNTEKLGEYWKQNTIDSFFGSYKEKVFDELDSRYCQIKDSLYDLQVTYIRNNPDTFVFVAQ